MNILLVYPEYPNTFWSFKHILKFVSKKATFPPLGLLTIASLLPEEWKKKLVDLNVSELKDKHIKWADMVFISAMLIQKESTQDVINRCKGLGKTVVAGGPAFTAQYERFIGVDHLILDEAEMTLPVFLDSLKRGKPRRIYRSEEKPDIKKTPPPLWPLINFKDYVTMSVQYSRGCPFNCEFCDIIMLNGRVPRTKSPEQFIAEIQLLYDSGYRGSLFIVDDNFIGNKVNVKKMLLLLTRWQKKNKYPFKLLTEASVNLADDEELMRMMSAANFHKVFLGIETPNATSLEECGKMQNIKRNLAQAVKAIQKNGMQVMGGFIIGFDSDTDSVFDAQIRFIQEVGIVTAMVGILTALPHTRLWHRLKAEGRLISDSTGDNTSTNLNFIPLMGKDRLLAGYKKVLSTIYSPRHYYRRINIFIRNYNPTIRNRLCKDDIGAFIRSMWKIGILSRTRLLYWKLIIKTLFTKIKALPIAVELAIHQQHFEKITRKMFRNLPS